ALPISRTLESAHRLEHRDSAPRPEILRESPPLALHGFQRRKMAACEIDHVDVVAYAGAVARRVVAAEHPKSVAKAHGDLGDIGHDVVRNTLRVLTDQSARVRPCW